MCDHTPHVLITRRRHGTAWAGHPQLRPARSPRRCLCHHPFFPGDRPHLHGCSLLRDTPAGVWLYHARAPLSPRTTSFTCDNPAASVSFHTPRLPPLAPPLHTLAHPSTRTPSPTLAHAFSHPLTFSPSHPLLTTLSRLLPSPLVTHFTHTGFLLSLGSSRLLVGATRCVRLTRARLFLSRTEHSSRGAPRGTQRQRQRQSDYWLRRLCRSFISRSSFTHTQAAQPRRR